MSGLQARVRELRARIEAAAQAAERDPGCVRLIAVSKGFPAPRIVEAVAAGLTCFGESRVQEAAQKLPAVHAACGKPLEWHLIGRLQRNKARRAVELFEVIHSVDRLELAAALDRGAEALGRRPRVLLQVNVDDEPQKGGVPPSSAAGLLEKLVRLPNLEVVGLMAIPPARPDPEQQRPSFARLRSLLEELKLMHPGLVELSMGMSADFEVAIQEGATWVRIGTAIFGERTPA